MKERFTNLHTSNHQLLKFFHHSLSQSWALGVLGCGGLPGSVDSSATKTGVKPPVYICSLLLYVDVSGVSVQCVDNVCGHDREGRGQCANPCSGVHSSGRNGCVLSTGSLVMMATPLPCLSLPLSFLGSGSD